MAVKVAVVDDTVHVRQMLVEMLGIDGFDVVGQGENAADALRIAVDDKPDVLIIDYSMPETDGLAAARRIKNVAPNQAVVLYTAYLDDALVAAAKDAGVSLCIGKVEGLETLERSISELCLQLGKE